MAIETRTSRLIPPREIKTAHYTVNLADYPSTDAALQHLKSFDYSDSAWAILQLPAGLSSFQSSGLAENVIIQGVTPLDLTMTSIQSTSGTFSSRTIVINVAESVSGVAVGDYLGLGPMTGGTLPLLIAGTAIVTAVDTVNKRLTFVLASAYSAATPSGAITGPIKVFKSYVTLPTIDVNIWITGVAVTSTPSIMLQGSLFSVDSFPPCAFYGGVDVQNSGFLFAKYCFFGNGGLNMAYGAACNVDDAMFGNSPNVDALLKAVDNCSVSAWNVVISGSAVGALATVNSSIDLKGARIAYNILGVKASHASLIGAFNCTFTGNTTDKSPATFETVGNVGSYVSNTDPSA